MIIAPYSSLALCTFRCHMEDCNSFFLLPKTTNESKPETHCYTSGLSARDLVLPIHFPGYPAEETALFTTKEPLGMCPKADYCPRGVLWGIALFSRKMFGLLLNPNLAQLHYTNRFISYFLFPPLRSQHCEVCWIENLLECR